MKTNGEREKKPRIEIDQNLIPPDGKYGWIIVLSYAIANVSIQNKCLIMMFQIEFFFCKISIQ